jgi:hypothetical protein
MKDQFGLDSTMNSAGKKRLSEQPKASRSVKGIEVNTIGSRPSASKTVKGMPKKLK